MTGGICDNCGFPLTKMRKKFSSGNKYPSWKPECKRVMGNGFMI